MTFYFTGTGNSLYAAKRLDGDVLSIPRALEGELNFTGDTLGIVCPVYGHEMPRMVKEFIEKASFETDYFYLVLTYGARHGGAAELAANFFAAAGKRVDYIATVEMADNFLPVFDMNEQRAIDKGEESRLSQIGADIAARRRGTEKVTAKDRLAHRAYLALVSNRDERVWSQYEVSEDCVGCGICTRVCPSGCIRLENQRAVYCAPDSCQACMACIHACPQAAIGFKLDKPEKNPAARYRNEHITLAELIAANENKNNIRR